jgi:hypothetical protein
MTASAMTRTMRRLGRFWPSVVSGCLALATTTVAVVSVAVVTERVTAAAQSTPFKITPKRENDVVDVNIQQDRSVFLVKSPSGISQVLIERTAEKWPDVVVIRLQLKGLESFRATHGKVALEASVSSQDAGVRLWKDGKEDAPLDAKDPLWMDIRLVGRDGKRTKSIPLEAGFFEMELPKAFFAGNPKSITLAWVDFFRN